MELTEDTIMSESDLSLRTDAEESFSHQDDHLSNNPSEEEPFSLLCDSPEKNVEESPSTVSFQTTSSSEVEASEGIEQQAVEIVNQVIDDASLNFKSSGDFSMLNDASALNKNSTHEGTETEDKLKNDKLNNETELEDEANKDMDNLNESSDKKVDEWLDILGNGLLKKKVTTPGKGKGTRPERGQEVTVLIETLLEDETVVEQQQELKFVLADQEVTDAIDLSVNLMENGEKCRVVSDAKYCYGETGNFPKIPPNSNLIYNLELVNIQEGPYNSSTPVDQRLNWVDEKRKLGNKLYIEEDYNKASAAYLKCNRVLQQALNQDQPDNTQNEILTLNMKCHNNLAAAYMKLNRWKDALKACEIAETIDAGNVKTFFRKGKILANLGETEKAIITLKKAVALSPDDKVIQNELAKQQKKLNSQKTAEKQMYQRMLGESVSDKQEAANEKPKESWIKSPGLWIGGSLVAIGAAVLLGAYMLHK